MRFIKEHQISINMLSEWDIEIIKDRCINIKDMENRLESARYLLTHGHIYKNLDYKDKLFALEMIKLGLMISHVKVEQDE